MEVKTMIYFIIIYLVIGFLYASFGAMVNNKIPAKSIDDVFMFLMFIHSWPISFLWSISTLISKFVRK